MKKIRYFLEYLLVKLWITLIKKLSLVHASNFSASLFKAVGMKLKVSNTARKNLKIIFPEIKDKQREEILEKVWENFGRMAGESPIFFSMSEEKLMQHVNIIGIENALKFKGKRALFFTAHMGNWEVARRAVQIKGIDLYAVYRSANNKMVEKLLSDLRSAVDIPMIPKGKTGAKQLIDVIKQDKHIVMLLDQKMNDGIKVPFLGKDAMTAPAIATLALKYGCPIIPIQVVRRNKYYFDVIIKNELDLSNKNVNDIMTEINEIIGQWVKENPDQWFWLHNRWIGEKDAS